MGMPITVEIVARERQDLIAEVFRIFDAIDQQFSTYSEASEITKVNAGLDADRWSQDMKEVMRLCDQTKLSTMGYFDINRNGQLDPSGLVKGWAIKKAAKFLDVNKISDYFIDAGGDIQTCGLNGAGEPWLVGIQNPFDQSEIIKTIRLSGEGVATSGTYKRGQHIYDPFKPERRLEKVKSISVIGPDIYEADRFATAAFAMGSRGIDFIEATTGLEGYMIDEYQMATLTSGFYKFVSD